ncbi:MAG: VWA domain-containing protein [Acidobacteriota bacterium]
MALSYGFKAMGLELRTLHLVICAVIFCANALAQLSATDNCFRVGLGKDLEKRLANHSTETDLSAKKNTADLSGHIIRLAADFSTNSRNILQNEEKNKESKIAETETQSRQMICRILETSGIPTDDAYGPDAVDAFLYLVSRTLKPSELAELYPAIIQAYRLKFIRPNVHLAVLVDKTRLAFGRKQLFGTQAIIRGDLLLLAPLDDPENVDSRRQRFGLSPLREYERSLQNQYRKPVIRSFQLPERSPNILPPAATPSEPANLWDASSGEPEIRIATALVKVDVLVRDTDAKNPASMASLALKKEDFRIFDNGRPAVIDFFNQTDAPFDIVLLLDLSGSTSGKTGLIKKSTRRFIQAKRPEDRLAIVTFTDKPTLVSDFEKDPEILLKRVKDIGGFGGSYVWDAFAFAMDLLDKSEKQRRKAIVSMTDGVDNALWFSGSGSGSRTSFADLAERVSRESVIIFPVYLDTEKEYPRLADSYKAARASLHYLAEASGGNYFTANKLEELEHLYDQVLSDVGAVYTLGFSPEIREGESAWHTIKIDVPSRPELRLKYRPGYFVQ